jgi:hypothetical protein
MADIVTGHAHVEPGPGHDGDPLGQAGDPFRVDLWRAVLDLAREWATTPVVRRFAADLPRNANQRKHGIPGRLQEMEARGAGISARPLRLTSTIRMMQRMPHAPTSGTTPNLREWEAWLVAATDAEIAHGIMTAWLRSRMPGYPSIPAPQLVVGAPLTADGYGQPRPWTRDERGQGLQLRDPPPEITRHLNATAREARQIVGATQTLGTTMQATGEWQRMQAAADALTGPDRAELGQARRTVSERLSEAEIGKVSPDERLEFREAALEEVLAGLFGPAAEYVQAFEAANRALETAASDVFGQLAVYGQPTLVRGPQDIDLRLGNRGQLVSFTRPLTGGDDTRFHLETGQLVWLGDELTPDAAQLMNLEYSDDVIMGERERYTGTLLPGTGKAWKR